MRAARFYLDALLAPNTRIELPVDVAHHAVRVLRLRNDEPVVLFNGQGGEWRARLSIEGKKVIAIIETFDAVERESDLPITLVQSWIATEKLDWLIEKSVELGVHSIVLAPAQRSVIRITGDRLAKRLERLRDLVIAACAQCGRNRVPHIAASASFEGALRAGLVGGAMGLLLEPNASSSALSSMTDLGNRRITLAVGPEGGFNADELALAADAGYSAYRLGPRVLRAETAGLAALAALQAIAGAL